MDVPQCNLANYVLSSKVGTVKGLWSLEYQITVEQSLLINPTVYQLLQEDFEETCHNQNVYVSQDYGNLIGYAYLSLEYSAFVYTAQREYQIRLEVQNKYST